VIPVKEFLEGRGGGDLEEEGEYQKNCLAALKKLQDNLTIMVKAKGLKASKAEMVCRGQISSGLRPNVDVLKSIVIDIQGLKAKAEKHVKQASKDSKKAQKAANAIVAACESILCRANELETDFISKRNGFLKNYEYKINQRINWQPQDLKYSLFNVGYLGLVHAFDHYKPEMNRQFGSYCEWWINAGVTGFFVEERRWVGVPEQKRKLANRVEQILSQHPYLSTREEKVLVLQEHDIDLTPDKLDDLLLYLRIWHECPTEAYDDDGENSGVQVRDEKNGPIDIDLDKIHARQEINKALAAFKLLHPEMWKVLHMRFLEDMSLGKMQETLGLNNPQNVNNKIVAAKTALADFAPYLRGCLDRLN
jgi:RNA polymerase sigma factor (sigma-70 family)